jgi:hypothetical protein
MDDEAIKDQGIDFEPGRFEAAEAIYAKLRGPIEELRRVPLPFLAAVEPAAAWRWIDNGGEE